MDRGIPYVYEAIKLKYTLKPRFYYPDWKISTASGKTIYVETKGYLDPDDKLLLRAVKEQHPELDIRFVFAKADKKFLKSGKMTHADWADKYGFPWAEKVIPDNWLEE